MWLSEEEEENEPLGDDDFMPSDQLSDMLDDMPDEAAWSEEELEDMHDPTDIEDYG